MPFIQVDGVTKVFGSARRAPEDQVHALRHVSLTVEQGETVALLGPSGSGKTTLLRCIAGLESPSAGDISIGGRTVFSSAERVDVPTRARDLGMIFQTYALWPHMTVLRNIAYPLAQKGASGKEQKARVHEYLDLVDCAELADRYPHQLSGGQQQRVALARALVAEPQVVLFDEPLSNLDAGLREQLRYYIRRIKRSLGFTGIYVTHDQVEAFYVGDRVAVMQDGGLLQSGTPEELHDRPSSGAVAAFLGATNELTGELDLGAGQRTFVADGGVRLDVSRAVVLAEGPGRVTLRLRPDECQIAAPETPGGVPVRVLDAVALGGAVEHLVELSSGVQWRCRGRGIRLAVNDLASVIPDPERLLVFAEDDSAQPTVSVASA